MKRQRLELHDEINVLDRDGERVLRFDSSLDVCEEVFNLAEYLHQ